VFVVFALSFAALLFANFSDDRSGWWPPSSQNYTAPHPILRVSREQHLVELATKTCSWKGAVGLLCDPQARRARLLKLKNKFPGCPRRKCKQPYSQLEPLYTGEEWPSADYKQKFLSAAKFFADEYPKCWHTGHTENIYLDLGARTFSSSVGWFRSTYPGGQNFHVHAFDIEERFRQEHEAMGVTFHNVGVSTTDGLMWTGQGNMKGLSSRASADSRQVQTVNMSRWILEELPMADNPLVVLKMDIEGLEHEVIPELIYTGAVCKIDEFFLECHYARRSHRDPNRSYRECDDSDTGQPKLPCLHRHECVALLSLLRDLGIHAHEWT